MRSDQETLFSRIVLVGDSSVGKTSILNQLSDHRFNESEKSTIGAAHQILIEELENGQKLELQIWDTAGQEVFRSLGPIYYRSANAAIAVIDQTSRDSFVHIDSWITSFQNIAGTDTTVMILANKMDLVREMREHNENDNDDVADKSCIVEFAEVQKYANDNKYIAFQTSAKTGEGIREMFKRLVSVLVENGQVKKPKQIEARREVNSNKTCC